MKVRLKVMKLLEKYNTSNPYVIAKKLGIQIMYGDFGKTKGFYKKILRKKYIFISNNLNEFEQKLVCAHELGHAILHSNRQFEFLLDTTNLYKQSIIEDEANEFASWLILGEDDDIENNQELADAEIKNINLVIIENIINIRKKKGG